MNIYTDKKVVAVGGGHGLGRMLAALKDFGSNATGIVATTVAAINDSQSHKLVSICKTAHSHLEVHLRRGLSGRLLREPQLQDTKRRLSLRQSTCGVMEIRCHRVSRQDGAGRL